MLGSPGLKQLKHRAACTGKCQEQSVLTKDDSDLQEAVRVRQNYADAYTGMGVSLKELKRKEEAEQCFAQVVRLRPHCALSLGNLAGRTCLVLEPSPAYKHKHRSVVGPKHLRHHQLLQEPFDCFQACFNHVASSTRCFSQSIVLLACRCVL